MLPASEPRAARPLRWQVNALELAGLGWGDTTQKPLLALHGWLDNAASFSVLAPLLCGYHVVAPDLTGHGQSAHRSADASYQIWDDLPELLGVLDALGWDTFDLVGHSRGAIIATLLASAFPERVRHLVLLDAVSPHPIEQDEFPRQLREALQDKRSLLGRANRVFPNVEAALASRITSGLSAASARPLVERNLRNCAQGVTWTTDPRLRGASAVKLTAGQIQAVLQALSMPALLLLAQDSAIQVPQAPEGARRFVDDIVVHTIEGGHHFHMEAGVNAVAQQILHFLAGDDAGASA